MARVPGSRKSFAAARLPPTTGPGFPRFAMSDDVFATNVFDTTSGPESTQRMPRRFPVKRFRRMSGEPPS